MIIFLILITLLMKHENANAGLIFQPHKYVIIKYASEETFLKKK
jgi:hypothetical protein